MTSRSARPKAARKARRRSAHTRAPETVTLARLSQGLRLTTALCSVFVLPVLSTTTAWALPQGGVVEAGKAKIITKPTKVIIIQKTPSVVVDWNSFNVGAGEKVVIKQAAPTWTELNRVTGGGGASVINGKVNALGTVAISNPSGVTFGPAAKVTVGSLIATSSNIRNQDFTAGNYNFNIAGHPDAAIINQGTISVSQGGLAALVAPGVQNSGVINARLGKVALAAGNGFAVDLHGDRLINFAVDSKVLVAAKGTDGKPLAAAVENSGTIRADGGVVQITTNTARNIVTNAINVSGVVQAQSVAMQNGEIVLDGGAGGGVQVSGKLDVSGRGAGQTAGKVAITGQAVNLAATAKVDARGTAGGGTVQVGGGLQGSGTLAHATTVTVAKGAKINASATQTGNGGTVSVWSDGTTQVAGTLKARGGALGGNGGTVETSGHQLDVTGIKVDAAAPQGVAGTWLLDPYNLTVTTAATTALQSPTGTWSTDISSSNVSNTDINLTLNAGTSVVLQTTGFPGDGNGNGDITVSAAILKSAGAATSLTLKAFGSIIIDAGISSTSGALAVTLNANTQGFGGYVDVTSLGSITTLGGNLVIGGGPNPLTFAALGTAVRPPASTLPARSAPAAAITINGTGFANGINSYASTSWPPSPPPGPAASPSSAPAAPTAATRSACGAAPPSRPAPATSP